MARLVIILFALSVIGGYSAQPAGGFIDSSFDPAIREENTSISIPATIGQPITLFSPYGTTIHQVNVGCTPSSDILLADKCSFPFAPSVINAAYGLDTLLVMNLIRIYVGDFKWKQELQLYSFNKTSGETVDRGQVFPLRPNPIEYYFSATDPYRLYMMDFDGVLWTMQTNVGITEKAHSIEPYRVISKGDGSNYYVEASKACSSADDKVHSMMLTELDNRTAIGCYVTTPTRNMLINRTADYVIKCILDLSGEYLVVQEKYLNTSTAPKNGTLRIVKLADLTEQIVESKGYEFVDGAWDVGYRSIIIAEYNYAGLDKTTASESIVALGGYLLYAFTFSDTNTRNLVYANNDRASGPKEITWRNAKDGVPLEQQWACGGGFSGNETETYQTLEYSRRNEIMCFKLTSSPSGVLALSPTTLSSYDNLAIRISPQVDPSGRYFAWSLRTDSATYATVLEIPYHLLVPPYTPEPMQPVDYFGDPTVPITFAPEVPVPDPFEPSDQQTSTIEPWAWAVGAVLLAVILGAWIVFAIFFIRFKFRINQRQR